MSAHTPGPWVIDWYDNYSEETGDTLPPTHAQPFQADGTKGSPCVAPVTAATKIAMADAHLIAAVWTCSPLLGERCRLLLRQP